jgi:isoleucyl-tRNA synthetase
VGATGWHGLPADLRAEISAELNVESLEGLGDSALVHVAVKPNFRALGKRFGKQTQLVATAIGDAEPDALVAAMRAGAASVDAAELGVVSLEEDDLIITETPQEGWAVATGAGETVALDLEITPALRRAGTAREVIRALQEARKTSGLDVSDRIRVIWEATEDDVAESVTEHATAIAEEVLAVEFEQGSGAGEPSVDESGLRAWIARV